MGGMVTHTWCDRHWQPYRNGQGNGIAATMAVIDRVMKHPQIMRECGYDPAAGREADASMLNAAIASHAPLCCFLGDEAMQEVLGEAVAAQREPRGEVS